MGNIGALTRRDTSAVHAFDLDTANEKACEAILGEESVGKAYTSLFPTQKVASASLNQVQTQYMSEIQEENGDKYCEETGAKLLTNISSFKGRVVVLKGRIKETLEQLWTNKGANMEAILLKIQSLFSALSEFMQNLFQNTGSQPFEDFNPDERVCDVDESVCDVDAEMENENFRIEHIEELIAQSGLPPGSTTFFL